MILQKMCKTWREKKEQIIETELTESCKIVEALKSLYIIGLSAP